MPDRNIIVEDSNTWNQVWSVVHHRDVLAPEIAELHGQEYTLTAIETGVRTQPVNMIPGFAWRFVQIEKTGAPIRSPELTETFQSF